MGGQQLLERLTLSMLKSPNGQLLARQLLARATTNRDDATFSRLLHFGPPSIPLTSAMLTVVLGSNHPEGVRIGYLQQLLTKDASLTGKAVLTSNRNGSTVLDLAIQKGFVAGVECIVSHCKPETLPALVKHENAHSRLTPVALSCR